MASEQAEKTNNVGTSDRELTIRAAVLEDDVALAELTRALLEYERTLVEPVNELSPWAASREELRKQLKLPNMRFFVAEQHLESSQRRVVGYVKALIIGKQLARGEVGVGRWVKGLIERAARWAYVSVLGRPRAAVQLERGYIAGVFVHPAARRSGVGRKLMAAAEAWFRAHGIRACELHVLEANRSGRDFWEEIGYTPVSLGMRKKL